MELAEHLFGVALGVLIFLQPIQSWLSRRVFTPRLFGISFVSSGLTWLAYRGLAERGLREARPMVFITVVVIVAIALQWLWCRLWPAAFREIPEERRFGWVLFTGLMTLAVVIFVPLGAALLRSVLR